MKKVFLFIFCFLFSFSSVSAAGILVENVFSDISADYEYRDELQLLYDRGMIYPDEQGRFNPYGLLKRDEFVGISMEVICKRCIQPHTEFQYIEKFLGEDVYYDIDSSNKYFYCVAEADALNYVKGYDAGFQCEDGTQKDFERPFCTNNNITFEEAIAVILRNSGIFTIEDNQRVMQDILAGRVTASISDDVNPKNIDGTPYTFYGYFAKAVDFRLVEYDAQGNEEVYTMVDIIDGKLRPKKSVTKEEFLRIAYVALKSNSCTDIIDNELALAIDIWEKTCEPGDQDCTISGLDDPTDTYDLTPDVEGFCEEGIEDPTGYIWRFYNLTNGDEFFEYGSYLDNIQLPSQGEWRVYLTVRDKCGNTGEVYSTIFAYPPDTVSDNPEDFPVVIILYPEQCTEGDDCTEITPEQCGIDEVCDFEPEPPVTSCSSGIKNPDGYTWTFIHEDSTEVIIKGKYVDNYEFLKQGRWTVQLEIVDNCGNSGQDTEIIIIGPITPIALSVDIIADPIIGYENLLVDFEAVTHGGTPPFNYAWDFGDTNGGYGLTIDHLYTDSRVFQVLLRVTDSKGLTGSARVLIKVLEADSCETDTDKDGIFDCDDLCSAISGLESNSGCPIVEIGCGENCSCPEGYECNIDDINLCPTEGFCEPIIEKKSNCLYNPTSAAIFGNASCNSCPCGNFLDFLADIRECDVVFPAITSPDATNIYSRGNLWEIRD